MSTEEFVQEAVQISVENIGGIEQTDLTASPGVTALTGRNATNRTSLLQAVMAALGSDTVSLKGDAAVLDDDYQRVTNIWIDTDSCRLGPHCSVF